MTVIPPPTHAPFKLNGPENVTFGASLEAADPRRSVAHMSPSGLFFPAQFLHLFLIQKPGQAAELFLILFIEFVQLLRSSAQR